MDLQVQIILKQTIAMELNLHFQFKIIILISIQHWDPRNLCRSMRSAKPLSPRLPLKDVQLRSGDVVMYRPRSTSWLSGEPVPPSLGGFRKESKNALGKYSAHLENSARKYGQIKTEESQYEN